MEKRCTICKQVLPIEEFRQKKTRIGTIIWCSECKRCAVEKYLKVYRKTEKAIVLKREQSRRYKARLKEKRAPIVEAKKAKRQEIEAQKQAKREARKIAAEQKKIERNSIIDGKAWCSGCKQFVDVGDFGKDARKFSGRQSYCKACERKRLITYREKNPEIKIIENAYYQHGLLLEKDHPWVVAKTAKLVLDRKIEAIREEMS